MGGNNMNAYGAHCMLCGKEIVPGKYGLCAIILVTHWNEQQEQQQEQQLFCHEDCIKKAAHKTVPLYILDERVFK
jgi:hypothetical protein